MASEIFNEYFLNIYGDGWSQLYEALCEDEKQIAFQPSSAPDIVDVLTNLSKWQSSLYSAEDRTQDQTLLNYILDPASLLPVYALDIQPGDEVCDLCAAPGGKSLGILSQLQGQGRLVSNDSSKDRYIRLKKVLSQYLTENQKKVSQVTFKDGQKFGFYFPKKFNKVLVDSPCSSERHLIKNPKYMDLWTPKKSKMLSQKQYTLLCAAILISRPGGKIVYSTCSINPIENDAVIEKILKKKSDSVELDTLEIPYLGAKKTEYGWMIRPDVLGYGPIYVSRLLTK